MKRVANRYIKAVSRDGRLHDRTCERRRTQNETTKTFWLHSFDVDGCDGARDSLPVSRDREPLTSTMAIRILSRISSIDSSSRKKKKKEKRERIAFVIRGCCWKTLSRIPRVICLPIFDLWIEGEKDWNFFDSIFIFHSVFFSFEWIDSKRNGKLLYLIFFEIMLHR